MEENKKDQACNDAEEIKEETVDTDDTVKDAEPKEEPKEDDGAPLKFKDKKKLKKLEAELEKTKADLLAEQDKYMRLYAEYDNFRRRSAKEREGVYTEAYSDAVTQILPIIDNLERATQYIGDDPDSPMAKGIELTVKSCVEALNKMGVYEIEALGKPFDPNFHNAVMHVDDDSFGENEIVEVFMKGYVKGDKVLRFSMVKVAN